MLRSATPPGRPEGNREHAVGAGRVRDAGQFGRKVRSSRRKIVGVVVEPACRNPGRGQRTISRHPDAGLQRVSRLALERPEAVEAVRAVGFGQAKGRLSAWGPYCRRLKMSETSVVDTESARVWTRVAHRGSIPADHGWRGGHHVPRVQAPRAGVRNRRS